MPKTATAYQPHLLDPHSAQPQPVSPANGRSFKLAELYAMLDCRTVDVVRLSPELILIIDDEGKFRNPAYLNLLATYLMVPPPARSAGPGFHRGPRHPMPRQAVPLIKPTAHGPATNRPHLFHFQPQPFPVMSTKVKPQRSASTEAVAASTTTPEAPVLTLSGPTTTVPAYLIEKADEATGEVVQVSRFRYLPGHPRQVRFDAKAGQFNIGGVTPLGSSLAFIPLAWRVFQDDILNMGRKLWAELFFADDKGAVCAVLFHGYSVENLYRLIEPLFYDDLTLADVTVKVTAEKKQTTKDGKTATYYIAQFSYEAADPAEVAARRDFARDFPIWRAETYTGAADMRIQHGYTVPVEEDPISPEPAAAELVALSQAA